MNFKGIASYVFGPWLILLIGPGFVLAAPGSFQQSDKDRLGLAGPVKTVVHKQEVGDGADKLVTIHKFDRNGNIVQELTQVERNGSAHPTKTKTIVTYDSAGRKLTETETDERGNIETKKAYFYGSDGHLVGESILRSGKLLAARFYEYDQQGKLAQDARYIVVNPSTLDSSKTIFKHDHEGNNVQEEIYKGGHLTSKAEKHYDSMGHLLEIVTLDAGGHIVQKQIFSYDDRGTGSNHPSIGRRRLSLRKYLIAMSMIINEIG